MGEPDCGLVYIQVKGVASRGGGYLGGLSASWYYPLLEMPPYQRPPYPYIPPSLPVGIPLGSILL